MACINAGCDAVYLGGSKFGARAYAQNFIDEEIVRAVKYAHVFNKKVYLTINTLIKEREFKEAIDYVSPFAKAGIDAFIVQDIGLISALKSQYPDVDIHVSTQGFATGVNSVKFFKDLGAARVVLARELSLKEISEIKDKVDIELETFIHGAMCYSYSGQCLFSSSLGGRSGNRGRCAGPCRLSYKPYVDGVKYEDCYTLSMKDQCTIEILPKLIDAGIDSLKIEGRMKKPEYTAFTTAIYRKYLDNIYENGKCIVSGKDMDNLRKMYMRSEIQTGYYYTSNGSEMISLNNPGYSGSDNSLMNMTREKYMNGIPKCIVSGFFYAHAGEPVSLSLYIDDKCVTVSGECPEISTGRPLTLADVKKQISKMGDSVFELNELNFDMEDNLFIPVSKLNSLRRRAVEELYDEF